jgi:3',5'-cyclic AMP phosphodiesterase CpdA
MSHDLTRRDLLKLGAAAAAGTIAGTNAAPSLASGPANQALDRPLRVAHLTDIHLQPERRAAEGTVACLHHVQQLTPAVDLIITGGDLIMDSFEADRARTKLQWDLFTQVFRGECSLPVEHTLGNHDIWGWAKSKSATTGEEPEYGKKWALDVLALAKPYRSFDRGGWHIINLDSVMNDGEKYLGRLDDEQFDWLQRDLAKLPAATPVMIVSHVPILGVSAINELQSKLKEDKPREFNLRGSRLMTDGRKLRELFRERPSVKLCLSGHIHHLDRVEFKGVTYIGDGAVSGAWWKGPNDYCPEGYGVVDLHADGTWSHKYETYGWKADPRAALEPGAG